MKKHGTQGMEQRGRIRGKIKREGNGEAVSLRQGYG